MITISKENLAADLSEYLRRVTEDREEIVVTDEAVPVLKVVPVAAKVSGPTVDELFADVRPTVKIHGDLTAPTSDEWNEV